MLGVDIVASIHFDIHVVKLKVSQILKIQMDNSRNWI